MSKPVSEFIVEVARHKDTNEPIPFVFTVVTSKRLSQLNNGDKQGLQGFGAYLIQNVDGIESMEFGNENGYIIRFMVAQTFDPVAVQQEIIEALKLFQSDLVLPASAGGRQLKFPGR